MIGPARIAAYEIGRAVASGRADLPAALAHQRPLLADERDRALAAEIATGVQRWRAALDHLIVHAARRPLDRLDPEVVEILRLSVYQLLHLQRVPAAAVVDDAVDLTRRVKKASARGFVNGVLRSIARSRPHLPLPPRPTAPDSEPDAALAYLTVTLSHPRWLAERWLQRLGFARAEAWMRFNNSAAPLTLRANRLRTTVEALGARLDAAGVRVERGRYAPDALLVRAGNPLREARADFEQGLLVVQDEASQLVTLLAGSSPGPRVLDTCASPGGKTTALAAAAPEALIIACDVRARRMDLLRATVASSGAANVRLVQADLLLPMPFQTVFDCVMVDAPCSGLGTLRRDPDLRWRRRAADLPVLARAQVTMLQHAAALVRPGGRLVYATCSSEPDENADVARAFLGLAPEFVRRPASHAALPPSVVDSEGCLRTEPDRHGLEAFYGVVFERQPGRQM
jgi:16S rRNA (cytosine967-C5)-methyltransferase